jgi:hypothetical protein
MSSAVTASISASASSTVRTRSDVTSLVHPQLEAARQIALGSLEFVRRDRLITEPSQLDEDRLESLIKRIRGDPGGDLERTGIGVVDQPRRDVVGEAQLLADRLEEATAHAVP